MSAWNAAEPFPLPAAEPLHAAGDETVPALLGDGLAATQGWQELINEEERRLLLADIARVALAVGQDLFGGAGSLGDLDVASPPAGAGPNDPCPRERLAFLQQAWPSLAGALGRIEAAPAARVVMRTHCVPVERARRVETRAVLAVLRASGGRPPGGTGSPARIEETVAAASTDTPHNRAVAACLSVWSHDLETIAALASSLDVPNVADAATHLRARVGRHLRREPWKLLPLPARPGESLSALSVLRSQTAPALYRFVGDTFLRYRQAFAFCWDNSPWSLPARSAWLLYEYWTVFQIITALRTLGLRAVHAGGWALNRTGLTFSLAKGSASRIRFARPGGGPTVTLGYNVLFPTGGANGNGYHARSHAMRPDIVLQRNDDGRLLVFDAKFKAYAEADRTLADERANLPLVLDINQAHAYRDALRLGPQRAVCAAWLLYAGRRDRPNLPVIAYPPATPEQPHGDGEVGALLLRPGGIGGEHLRQVVADFLRPV